MENWRADERKNIFPKGTWKSESMREGENSKLRMESTNHKKLRDELAREFKNHKLGSTCIDDVKLLPDELLQSIALELSNSNRTYQQNEMRKLIESNFKALFGPQEAAKWRIGSKQKKGFGIE